MNKKYIESEVYRAKLEQVGEVLQMPLNFMKDKYDHYVCNGIFIHNNNDQTILNSYDSPVGKLFVTHDSENNILYIEYYNKEYCLKTFKLGFQMSFTLRYISFSISG